MSCLSEHWRVIVVLRAMRTSANPTESHHILAGALPPLLASILPDPTFDMLRQKVIQLPEPPAHPRLAKTDWMAAAGIFLLVFLSTFPVVVPFIFIHDTRLALRVSNAVAIAMLFMAGYAFGRHSGFRPVRTGLAMVIIGTAMVGITIALGG